MPKQMNSDADSKKGSRWQTFLGTLTAATALITAIAGLLVALNQAGFLGGPSTPSLQSATTVPSQPRSDDATPAVSASNGTTYSVDFPLGTTVKFRNYRGEGTYEILAAQAERRSAGKLGLMLTIRMTNNGPADVGF